MDIAGLLDDVAELAKKRNWTEKALGGGIRGATLRGLLGFDAPEDATSIEKEAWRTGQALSNTPTPLALAAAPAALAKASKATKALPQEKALETARQNAVKMLGLPENNTPMERARALEYAYPDYKGGHQPNLSAADVGAPLHQLDKVYPADIYSPKAARYYGDGADPARDSALVRRMQALKDKPDEMVTVFRAVPKKAGKFINQGDWVTMDKQYAVEHGESALNGDYKIISTRTPAKTLYSPGDSLYELGIDKSQKFAEGPASMPTMQSPKYDFERSPFAAFDPARVNENDLLASLAALGIGVPMISGLLQEQE